MPAVWDALEHTDFSQLLSFLHGGVQVCLFPVFWSGINSAERRGMGEESSGASGVGHSVLVS